MTLLEKGAMEFVQELVEKLSFEAVERERRGGNPKRERDLIRESGLLSLLIPKEFGGLGGTWIDVVTITREIAKVDSSLAHVFAYHFINLTTTEFWGDEEQKAYYYRETAKNRLFWGNAFNPVDIQLFVEQNGDHFVLNGVKTFCTGSRDSDLLNVSAKCGDSDDLFIAVVPTKREGITVNEDWDSMGQRLTDSGSITFDHVIVKKEEVLNQRDAENVSEFAKIRLVMSHFILNHIFLGIMEGAFNEARLYTKGKTRPRSTGIEKAVDDPIIQRHYGELYVGMEAARLLVERTATIFQRLWDKKENVTAKEREELELAIYVAKVHTTQVGLDVTSRMFHVMGSRATANKYGYDRFWRNMRTLTLHVPVDTVIEQIGDWILRKVGRK